MEKLERMREPCPVCGCILTDSMDLVSKWEAERERDPIAAQEGLVKRLRAAGMTGHADLVELRNAQAPPDPRAELDTLYAHIRALVAASEVGDIKHALQGLLPEGFGDERGSDA